MLNSLVSGLPVFPASAFLSDQAKTVCITGHREKNVIPYSGDPLYSSLTLSAVKLMLFKYLDAAYEKGYRDFISGLATGTDLWAAQHIISKKNAGFPVRLIGAMPYLRHAEYFPKEYRRILADVEEQADLLLTVCTDPNAVYKRTGPCSELYRDRNYFLVDNSSAVIAFLSEGSFASGTGQTVSYAKRKGKIICRFGIEDVHRIIAKAGTELSSVQREISFVKPDFCT